MDPMKTTLDLSSTFDDDDNQAPTVGHPAETTTVLPSPSQATLHEFGAQPPSPSFPLPPRSSLVWDESWPSSTVVAKAPWRLFAPSLTNVVSISEPELSQSQPFEFSSSSIIVPKVQSPSLPLLPSPPPLSSTQLANAVSHSVSEMPQSLPLELRSSSTIPVPKVQPPPLDSPLPSQLLPTGTAPTHLPPLNPYPHPMQPQMTADNPNPANPNHQPLPLVLATPPPRAP
ncbi:hypothetical protein SLEP1_g38933 [Rubroshorea leprosula]|uniref:Uncharacterized protein n=1 Tax=Rubroshorea leprosula TaxID=152421 RepID=A0AAV5KYG5_9ROSI|nr:hypothetical protein SLEP1_g38933 [Rubroshorea leprosula]